MQFVAQKQVLNNKLCIVLLKETKKKEMIFFSFVINCFNSKDDKSVVSREIKHGKSASSIQIKSWSC
jgi:hypothetical protein